MVEVVGPIDVTGTSREFENGIETHTWGKMTRRFNWFASILVVPGILACTGSENRSGSDSSDEAPATPALLAAEVAEGVAEGEELYRTRGCVACHRIGGGRLVGPDLAGVTERRSEDWILAMIARPDSMLRVDATAKELLEEFMTPMPNQRVTPEQASRILSYIVSQAANSPAQ